MLARVCHNVLTGLGDARGMQLDRLHMKTSFTHAMCDLYPEHELHDRMKTHGIQLDAVLGITE